MEHSSHRSSPKPGAMPVRGRAWPLSLVWEAWASTCLPAARPQGPGAELRGYHPSHRWRGPPLRLPLRALPLPGVLPGSGSPEPWALSFGAWSCGLPVGGRLETVGLLTCGLSHTPLPRPSWGNSSQGAWVVSPLARGEGLLDVTPGPTPLGSRSGL